MNGIKKKVMYAGKDCVQLVISIFLMFPKIIIPTEINSGAVAWTGTLENTPFKNPENPNSIAQTTVDNPVLAPLLIDAPDSGETRTGGPPFSSLLFVNVRY